jgi:hypothetical protein
MQEEELNQNVRSSYKSHFVLINYIENNTCHYSYRKMLFCKEKIFLNSCQIWINQKSIIKITET